MLNKLNKKILSKLSVLFLFATFLVHCEGSGGSAREFSFDLGSTFTPSASLSGTQDDALDSALTTDDDVFQVILYTSQQGDLGVAFYGPVAVTLKNQDLNLYGLTIPGLKNGTYFLEYRLVHLGATSGHEDVVLASVTQSLVLTTNAVSVDLSQVSWVRDHDADRDGLVNLDELARGTDLFNPDSDGDGVTDSVDVFPTDSSEAYDTDADGVGQNRDNCPEMSNATQADGNLNGVGDDCEEDAVSESVSSDVVSDESVDEEVLPVVAIYVSADGDTAALGISPDAPTRDLQTAIQTAVTYGVDVLISGGVHVVDHLVLADGVSLYGGCAEDYSSCDGFRQTPENETTIVITGADESGVVLANLTQPLTLSGIVFESTFAHSSQILVAISNSTDVTLQGLLLNGNPLNDSEVLLAVSATPVSIDALHFVGAASLSSVGMAATDVDGVITNSIFDMGESVSTTAIDLNSSDLSLLHNTIDGGRHDDGTAYGLVLSSSSPQVVNNIFLTKNYDNQASVDCTGDVPTLPVTLDHNLFLRYSSDSSAGTGSGYVYAAYVTCAGTHFLTTTTQLQSGVYSELSALGNVVWSFYDLNDVSGGVATVFDGDYQLVTGSPAIGAGVNTGLVTDFTGQSRAGSDLGAFDY